MSRPILSRPRTRVYGCNYDKGESYYKPAIENLNRKYSGRPLFPEPRNSLADEIAARRSDIGSRNLGGRSDSYDDLDFCYGRGHSEDPFEDEFVSSQRRFKDRASAAFDEDLAELRRKRRDVQDRLFDMIDLNAEIEKARNTLEQADNVFGRHALRFDNQADDVENMSLAQRLERARTLAAMEVPETKPNNVKWTKLVPVEEGTMPLEATPTQMRRSRLNSLVDGTNNPYIEKIEPRGKRGYSKRKKSVSF